MATSGLFSAGLVLPSTLYAMEDSTNSATSDSNVSTPAATPHSNHSSPTSDTPTSTASSTMAINSNLTNTHMSTMNTNPITTLFAPEGISVSNSPLFADGLSSGYNSGSFLSWSSVRPPSLPSFSVTTACETIGKALASLPQDVRIPSNEIMSTSSPSFSLSNFPNQPSSSSTTISPPISTASTQFETALGSNSSEFNNRLSVSSSSSPALISTAEPRSDSLELLNMAQAQVSHSSTFVHDPTSSSDTPFDPHSQTPSVSSARPHPVSFTTPTISPSSVRDDNALPSTRHYRSNSYEADTSVNSSTVSSSPEASMNSDHTMNTMSTHSYSDSYHDSRSRSPSSSLASLVAAAHPMEDFSSSPTPSLSVTSVHSPLSPIGADTTTCSSNATTEVHTATEEEDEDQEPDEDEEASAAAVAAAVDSLSSLSSFNPSSSTSNTTPGAVAAAAAAAAVVAASMAHSIGVHSSHSPNDIENRSEKRHRCNFRTTDLDVYLWHVSRLQVPEQRALAALRANPDNPEERDEEGRPVYVCTAAFAVPNRLLRHQQTMNPARRPQPTKKKRASSSVIATLRASAMAAQSASHTTLTPQSLLNAVATANASSTSSTSASPTYSSALPTSHNPYSFGYGSSQTFQPSQLTTSQQPSYCMGLLTNSASSSGFPSHSLYASHVGGGSSGESTAPGKRLSFRCTWPKCGSVFRDPTSLATHLKEYHRLRPTNPTIHRDWLPSIPTPPPSLSSVSNSNPFTATASTSSSTTSFHPLSGSFPSSQSFSYSSSTVPSQYPSSSSFSSSYFPYSNLSLPSPSLNSSANSYFGSMDFSSPAERYPFQHSVSGSNSSNTSPHGNMSGGSLSATQLLSNAAAAAFAQQQQQQQQPLTMQQQPQQQQGDCSPPSMLNAQDLLVSVKHTVEQRVRGIRLPDDLFESLEPALDEWAAKVTDALTDRPTADGLLGTISPSPNNSVSYANWKSPQP